MVNQYSMNSLSQRKFLWFISLVATMGGLMFGFDIAIISGAVPFIQAYFKWDELWLGWGVSSLLLGCILGAFGSGLLTDRYGRKRIMMGLALFFALSSLATALATASWFFVSARIIGGLAVGAASVLSPMYIAEVAPSGMRGRLVSIYQLAITFGILVSYLVNFLLHDLDYNWRWMFATGVLPSVLFFTGLLFIPESPRWLFKVGRKEEAIGILARLSDAETLQQEVDGIENSLNTKSERTGISNLLKPGVKAAVLFGLVLAVLVQVSGINTVIDYAPKILLAAGVDIRNALLQTSLIGIINFIFTFVAIFLVDRIGRKPLYIAGSVGMTLTLLFLAAAFAYAWPAWMILLSILLFIAFFAACIGPVFWTLVAEIFPTEVRGTAVALVSFSQWIFNFLVVWLFPYVLLTIGGSATFLLLASMALLQVLVSIFWMPETKGKSLEEIEKCWK
jgi:sugar porter (SP) family MFS transporter